MSEHDQGDEQHGQPEATRRRRKRLSVDERLSGLLREKRAQLSRLKAREDALTSTLSLVTSERQRLTDEITRLEAACGG